MKKFYLIAILFLIFNTFLYADDFSKAKEELIGMDLIENNLKDTSLCMKAKNSENKNISREEKFFYHSLFLNCKILSIKYGFVYDSTDSNLSFCQKDQFNKEFSDSIYNLKKINKVIGIDKNILEKTKDWTLVHSYKYKEICTDNILKAITPIGLVDNTGLPPNEKLKENIHDDSRVIKKHEINRGPAVPEIEQNVINK